MAFYDGDIDENLLVEIPCEFCNDPFPMLFLIEHQTGCRYDLARVTEPTVEEIEDVFTAQEENETQNSVEPETFQEATQPESISASPSNENPVEKGPNILGRFLQYLQRPLASKNDSQQEENAPSLKESPKKNQTEKDFHEYEVLEEDLVEECATLTLGSIQNRNKRVEEKPSFKMPNIPVFANSDFKSFNHNDLPESDNEETESLEQFWEKAKIKLAQRSRAIKGKVI